MVDLLGKRSSSRLFSYAPRQSRTRSNHEWGNLVKGFAIRRWACPWQNDGICSSFLIIDDWSDFCVHEPVRFTFLICGRTL